MDVKAISAGLTLESNGIWYSTCNESVSYPAEGYDACFEIEDHSFWFKHRNQCITTLVTLYPPQGTILEIGGGNGFVSRGLEHAGFDVALLEPGRQGVLNAKGRHIKTVICATTETAKFTPETVPAIGVFDVIEHIKDDLTFLHSCRNLLIPQGRMYITVPAYQLLWSEEDKKAGHYRRYAMKEIITLLESAGFTVEFSSYIFYFLPLPIALLRALPYRLGLSRKQPAAQQRERDHAAKEGLVMKVLNKLLAWEITRLKMQKPIGFGGSCLLVVKKG